MDKFTLIFAISAFVFLVLFLKVFGGGKSRGGRVITRYTAKFQILDPRFETSRPEADYNIFKDGKPHKFEIDLERLPLSEGEELKFYINGKLLSDVKVDNELEAKFEHWSDEDVDFPQIIEGDILDIIFKGAHVMQGIFEQKW